MSPRWIECPACFRANPPEARECERCDKPLPTAQHVAPPAVAYDAIVTEAGTFALERIIGSGGMSTVYQARRLDPGVPTLVAVKVLLDRWVNNARARERFEREAHALQRIRHPGIVQIIATGSREGRLALVLELVEGHDLRTELEDVGTVPWDRAARWCAELLEALEAVHTAGFVHRDVKPSNCLLALDRAPPTVKLADLGVARAIDPTEARLTRDGSMGPGTVHYMSPEQITRGAAEPRSDVYSVGVMLHELIVGVSPFEADSDYEIQRAHVELAPDLTTLSKLAPAAITQVVEAALSKTPAGRPTSARAMAETLRGALSAAAKDGPEASDRGDAVEGASGGLMVQALLLATFLILTYLVLR